jgi:hypothetical protein
MRSPGLIFPEDSRWLCEVPEEPDPPVPLPLSSVTLGAVPPLECCASDGNTVKASSPPATRVTMNTCVVFIAASLVRMMKSTGRRASARDRPPSVQGEKGSVPMRRCEWRGTALGDWGIGDSEAIEAYGAEDTMSYGRTNHPLNRSRLSQPIFDMENTRAPIAHARLMVS